MCYLWSVVSLTVFSLAAFKKRFAAAESLLLQHGELDAAVQMYRQLYRSPSYISPNALLSVPAQSACSVEILEIVINV